MDNPELGRLIIKQVEAFPETFGMPRWICGTAACLGGHALLLSGYELRPCGAGETFVHGIDQQNRPVIFRRPDGSDVHDPGREAQMLLGMSDEEAGSGTGNIFSPFQHEDHALARFRALVEAS